MGYVFNPFTGTLDKTGGLVATADVVAALDGATVDGMTLGDLKESTSSVADAGAALTLDPLTGPMRSITLTEACVFSDGFTEGQSQKLRLTGDFTITWPAGMVWVGDTNGASGTAPAAPTTGWLHVELWKELGVLYGSFVGYSAS